jgi:ribosomal protein S18 acetylase RimI-like enzyme
MARIVSGAPRDVEAAAAFWASVSEGDGRTQDHLASCYLTAGGALFTVAHAQQDVVGLAVGTQARVSSACEETVAGRFHINTVFTQPAYRQAGIGRALLERLMGDARNAGYTSFQLWVHTGNRVARRLYETLGFEAEGLPADDSADGSIIRYICQGPGRAFVARRG